MPTMVVALQPKRGSGEGDHMVMLRGERLQWLALTVLRFVGCRRQNSFSVFEAQHLKGSSHVGFLCCTEVWLLGLN